MHQIVSTPWYALAEKQVKQEVNEIAHAIEQEITAKNPHIENVSTGGKTLKVRISFAPLEKTMICLSNYYVNRLGWLLVTHKKEGCNYIILHS